MADIFELSFNNRYPLYLYHMSEGVIEDKNLNIKEKEFYYETPTINLNSCFDNKFAIRNYLEKYLAKMEKHADEYIDTNYPNIYDLVFNYDLVTDYHIYFKRVYEDIEKEPEKVLSFQDGDGLPTFSLTDITPDFFLTPFKICAKAYVYVIG